MASCSDRAGVFAGDGNAGLFDARLFGASAARRRVLKERLHCRPHLFHDPGIEMDGGIVFGARYRIIFVGLQLGVIETGLCVDNLPLCAIGVAVAIAGWTL